MAKIVMKFGGTSVGDIKKIQHVATRVKREVDLGNQVVVVVSAMSGQTDTLLKFVHEISPMFDAREHDVVVSSGEQIVIGLLALAIQNLGINARSFLGWQLPIRTTEVYGAARILNIDTHEIDVRLKEDYVCVIAGFQGLSDKNRITTLGRGGSDTSALALAAAMEADRCDIYTDVDGIYTCDPRVVSRAKKMVLVSYEEMLEMSSLGAKVLHSRSVEVAMNYQVCLKVCSTFSESPGTLIVNKDKIMEQQVVSAIAYNRDQAKIKLERVPDKKGVASKAFKALVDENINVDMIVQNTSDKDLSVDLTFTVSVRDMKPAVSALSKLQDDIGFTRVVCDPRLVKISVIGVGMQSHTGVACTMFTTMAEKGINIDLITTSEIKISILIKEEYTELALRALHTAYGLDRVDL